jgi:ATP-dependent DNA helicase RecQ
MIDQVQTFRSKGIRAVRVGERGADVQDGIVESHYQLVFISPEAMLTSMKWRRMLLTDVYQENLVALIIDEAHCVKKWYVTTSIFFKFFTLNRGDEFRVHYSRSRELRSIISSSVGIMALTATASDSLISGIIEDTGMLNPYIVQISPDKENLIYSCEEISSIDDFRPLAESLQHDRMDFPRTIIYCQRQVDCGHLLQFFKKILGPGITEPPGVPYCLLSYRLLDCFSKGTQEEVKDAILKSCTQSHSVLRLIICTAAFGMGIDCVGVSRIVHWGPPIDIETYIQQTGRSGRSGEMSLCLMLHGKGLMRFCDKKIQNYINNKTLCRRTVLFTDFKMYSSVPQNCNCCDICAKKCHCFSCDHLLESFKKSSIEMHKPPHQTV